YIPDTYIKDEKQKIDMYKQFQSISSSEAITDLQDELIDRFGDYPQEVANLFIVSSLKRHAKQQRIESISEKHKKIEILVSKNRSQQVDGSKLFTLANQFGREFQLGTEGSKLKILFKWSRDTHEQRYDILENF